jgi:hypothetical protein
MQMEAAAWATAQENSVNTALPLMCFLLQKRDFSAPG